MKNKFKARLVEFFATYPNETECRLVTDGTIFTVKNAGYAKRHANDVHEECLTVTRAEMTEKEPKETYKDNSEGNQTEDLDLLTGQEPPQEDNGNPADTDSVEDNKAEDLNLLTVAVLTERAKALGLEIPKKATKAQIIALIESVEDYQPVKND